MVDDEIIPSIKSALERMDKTFCSLSQIDYSIIDDRVRKPVVENKYLERPIAYEFYHQLRKLIENGTVDFGGPIIQAEVDKTYQKCFDDGKIPDFIIHVKERKENLAVIEFKLATNLSNLKSDFQKLVEFKQNPDLEYTHGIEVIVGDTEHLKSVGEFVGQLEQSEGEHIEVVHFDTDQWKAKHYSFRYKE
ncbi:MAG: hypothetical protein ACFFDT_36825 [Candidatus Hodarchaeota archaeon]